MNKEIELLKRLIKTSSVSRNEDKTADIIEYYFQKQGFKVNRKYNNVWIFGEIDNNKKTVLLNSHHDTVKPVAAWTKNPYEPNIEGDKLYGLGSNDAGASLVSLINAFLYFQKNKKSKYNLVFAASAEEEVSGAKGISSIIDELGKIDFAIVGEPTNMQVAIAEKGLMVIDCIAQGKAGHAALNEGENAINIAIEDILLLNNLKFSKKSELLGDVKLTVTQINAGTQHNVIPDKCNFVIDIRTNEKYTNKQIFEILKKDLKSQIKARSFRLNSSSISPKHEIVKKAQSIGLKIYGSPTLSDQALMPFQSIKIGVGKSERSHIADEFIFIKEIETGINIYKKLLQ